MEAIKTYRSNGGSGRNARLLWFWTSVMDGAPYRPTLRMHDLLRPLLRASELLGKSQGDFCDTAGTPGGEESGVRHAAGLVPIEAEAQRFK
jgi:hypothetical protein